MQEAQDAFEQAFNVVLDAETADANVTSLLNQLNSAADLLAQAENAYRVGNNNLAISNADSVIQIAEQVSSAAVTAKQSAIVEGQSAFWIRTTSIIVGSVVFVLVMLVVWRWFKRRYIKNLSNTKPEVSSQ
jgi:hypothetical protein